MPKKNSSTALSNFYFSLRNLFRVTRHKARGHSKGRKRYIFMDPPSSNRQRIYDKRSRKIFSITIRDNSDIAILEQIYGNEDYCLKRLRRNEDITKWHDSIVLSGKTPLIIDCGAHIGLSSLYFSQQFPCAQIIGIEPALDNINLARDNCSQQNNVRFIHAGVSCECGRGILRTAGLANVSYQTNLDDNGDVNMISINSLLEGDATYSLAPFIIKIDIEGFEDTVFEKNTEWVDKFPLIIIELHDWKFPGTASSKNFLRCVSSLNRDFVYINENVFSIKNQ